MSKIHIYHSNEWCEAFLEEKTVLQISHDATGTGRPEKNIRNPQFYGDLEGEGHDPICHDASDLSLSVLVEPTDEFPKGSQAIPPRGVSQGRDVLGCFGVGGWEAIRDGLEQEVWETIWGPRV
ncbi:hypothetical protein CDL15_Pgr006263 [Punica granatum]|uniref:Uncharacterized protein n=1 Tax=Punica granatum TaxID=22663 RepID=A0A218X5E8_PUNGR|nr:hypothetical protein CDL15_Pgr006263 [Punica granatum]